MSVGKIIFAALAMLFLGALYYTGVWHIATLFIWQHPTLTWLPFVTFVAVGLGVGAIYTLIGRGQQRAPMTAPPQVDPSDVAGKLTPPPPPTPVGNELQRPKITIAVGPALLASFAVFLYGIWGTIISPPATGLDDIDYEVVSELPDGTQPRLLPRSGIRDDPAFGQSKEIHLVRDPEDGRLLWTGEWLSSWFNGSSSGVAIQPLDEVISDAEVVRAGFDRAAAGIAAGTMKGRANRAHPFSRVQYPVMVPTGPREAIAMSPYSGYRGFPFKAPYLKGVIVYHQDGTLEDLTPEEAAARPELAATGRIVPETVARSQAEALSRSEEFEGDIKDGDDNKQPYLTTIDEDTTMWVTIINHKQRNLGVRAIVLTNSTTGETDVWVPDEGEELISTEDVLAEARALPLQWEATRCCDSDGHSYTVTLREVVEPRLAFKDGKPYYLVTVVPTNQIALGRQVEFTLLLDAETGEKLDQFSHVSGGQNEDARLEKFFR